LRQNDSAAKYVQAILHGCQLSPKQFNASYIEKELPREVIMELSAQWFLNNMQLKASNNVAKVIGSSHLIASSKRSKQPTKITSKGPMGSLGYLDRTIDHGSDKCKGYYGEKAVATIMSVQGSQENSHPSQKSLRKNPGSL